MSDSVAGPEPSVDVWDLDTAHVDTAPGAAATPRRVLRARREAAEALGRPFESHVPGWSVAPASDYGSAVPLDDDIVRETSSR